MMRAVGMVGAVLLIAACGTAEDRTPPGTPEGPDIGPMPGMGAGDALADTLHVDPAGGPQPPPPLPEPPPPPLDSPAPPPTGGR